MINNIKISNMQLSDIDDAKEIWINQYKKYCNDINFPNYWVNNIKVFEEFLKSKIKYDQAIIAKVDGKLLGFLSYDKFPFHGEKSVVCRAMGHGAIEEYKESVYLSLYKNISENWVGKGIFNHMWTIFFSDETLKNILFNLGYGSYLIDAFNKCNIESNKKSICNIREATIDDAEMLFELVEESRQYYASSPIFLKRDEYDVYDIEDIVKENKIFIATHNDKLVGFLNLTISNHSDFIDMSIEGSGLIDELGAYIKSDFRNKNVGIELLKAANNYCRKINAPNIHVDFETANFYANKFWRKYFTPMLLSMRRTVNKDINDL